MINFMVETILNNAFIVYIFNSYVHLSCNIWLILVSYSGDTNAILRRYSYYTRMILRRYSYYTRMILGRVS